MNWKEYEKHAAKLLNEEFDKTIFKIVSQGEEDSTKPDIVIITIDEKNSFFLEVKMPNAQSSQFVLEIDNNKFIYGTRNKYKSNLFSRSIIDYMNKNFTKYNKVSQSGILIPIDEKFINAWIISNLQNKGIEYIFSGTRDNERIIPIDAFGEYFKATTFFRRKKSGSRILSKNKTEDFLASFNDKFSYEPALIFNDKKTFIKSKKEFKNNELFIQSIKNEHITYYLSKKENNKYEIKILSSTNNPNVIFQLSVKDSKPIATYDLNMFARLIIEKLNEADSK
ncbi:MAG: hypothetical protein PHG03_02505 [Bacilli bacterium]|nr:hypothetical protein [Bacilli bacterium]